MTFVRLAVASLAIVAAPLAAQTSPADRPSTPLQHDLGHDNTSARSDAIAAETAPGVAEANRAVAEQAPLPGFKIDEARYAEDLAAYRVALAAHATVVARDAAVTARQERAYALAMADWRAQVAACERGSRRACDAPAPRPADYW